MNDPGCGRLNRYGRGYHALVGTLIWKDVRYRTVVCKSQSCLGISIYRGPDRYTLMGCF